MGSSLAGAAATSQHPAEAVIRPRERHTINDEISASLGPRRQRPSYSHTAYKRCGSTLLGRLGSIVRLLDVRCAPIVTKFCSAVECRGVPRAVVRQSRRTASERPVNEMVAKETRHARVEVAVKRRPIEVDRIIGTNARYRGRELR